MFSPEICGNGLGVKIEGRTGSGNSYLWLVYENYLWA
jgi:hypothetical protein